MNRPAFDVYVRIQLAPRLEPSAQSRRAAQALKDRKCWFLFLPPYSPDLNPIEQAFAKLKAHLRRIGARTYDALIDAIGDVCGLFRPDECRNFLIAAGYAHINREPL